MANDELRSDSVVRRTVLAGIGAISGGTIFGTAAAAEDTDEAEPSDPDERVARVEDGPDLGELDHVIIASDFHLGSPSANTDNFEDFLERRFLGEQSDDPDALVLNGDGVEMWYRGMSSALLEFNGVTETFEAIGENGTEIIPIAGNHDWRLVDVNDDPVVSPEPWQFEEEVFFQSGGEEFVAIHGHQGEPTFNDAINEGFCLTTDEQGAQLTGESSNDGSDLRSTEYYQVPETPPEEVDISSLDPESEARRTRRETLTETVNAMYDEYVVFGHTHFPGVTDEYANSGSWTSRRTESVDSDTYLEIKDGDVELKEWP